MHRPPLTRDDFPASGENVPNADIRGAGPEGGDEGGFVVAQGTPEAVAAVPESYTGQYLKRCL